MHFEILVEDLSGKKALEILVPKIIGTSEHTYSVHSYKGIGHLPKDLRGKPDPAKRILLQLLPKLLRGYGKTFAGYPKDYKAAVILVCDLDNKNLKNFHQDLNKILNQCTPKPETRFCIAVEEGEAWFLGDIPAILAAYSKAKKSILSAYVNDSICGTWECLADAIYPGGAKALSELGWQAIGAQKSEWSEKISPRMNKNKNQSPSFCDFRDELLELAAA